MGAREGWGSCQAREGWGACGSAPAGAAPAPGPRTRAAGLALPACEMGTRRKEGRGPCRGGTGPSPALWGLGPLPPCGAWVGAVSGWGWRHAQVSPFPSGHGCSCRRVNKAIIVLPGTCGNAEALTSADSFGACQSPGTLLGSSPGAPRGTRSSGCLAGTPGAPHPQELGTGDTELSAGAGDTHPRRHPAWLLLPAQGTPTLGVPRGGTAPCCHPTGVTQRLECFACSSSRGFLAGGSGSCAATPRHGCAHFADGETEAARGPGGGQRPAPRQVSLREPLLSQPGPGWGLAPAAAEDNGEEITLHI